MSPARTHPCPPLVGAREFGVGARGGTGGSGGSRVASTRLPKNDPVNRIDVG